MSVLVGSRSRLASVIAVVLVLAALAGYNGLWNDPKPKVGPDQVLVELIAEWHLGPTTEDAPGGAANVFWVVAPDGNTSPPDNPDHTVERKKNNRFYHPIAASRAAVTTFSVAPYPGNTNPEDFITCKIRINGNEWTAQKRTVNNRPDGSGHRHPLDVCHLHMELAKPRG